MVMIYSFTLILKCFVRAGIDAVAATDAFAAVGVYGRIDEAMNRTIAPHKIIDKSLFKCTLLSMLIMGVIILSDLFGLRELYVSATFYSVNLYIGHKANCRNIWRLET